MTSLFRFTLFVTLFALFVTRPALAQTGTVTGTVIDDRTETPIGGVSVYVEGQSSKAETDASGRFSLVVEHGNQTIAASVIGYALLRTRRRGVCSHRWR